MFCPRCKKQFKDASTKCFACNKRLVARLPKEKKMKENGLPETNFSVYTKKKVPLKTVFRLSASLMAGCTFSIIYLIFMLTGFTAIQSSLFHLKHSTILIYSPSYTGLFVSFFTLLFLANIVFMPLFVKKEGIVQLCGNKAHVFRKIAYALAVIFVITLTLSIFTYTNVKKDGLYNRTLISFGEKYYSWKDIGKADLRSRKNKAGRYLVLNLLIKDGKELVFYGNDFYLKGDTFIILDRLIRENNIKYTVSEEAKRLLQNSAEYLSHKSS